MCCELKSSEIKPCGYIQPLVGRFTYDSETHEVHDDLGNLIGHGKPKWVNGEIHSIYVTLFEVKVMDFFERNMISRFWSGVAVGSLLSLLTILLT